MKKGKLGGLSSYLGTLGALLILCIVLTIASKNFLTYSNIMSVLKQTTFTALLSTGMLLCLITAGIDLSVGANATFCACICGMLVKGGMTNPVVLILIALIAGTIVGLINGTLLTRLHLPHPFVSTLGMKNFLWGASLLVTGSQMISGFPAGVMALGSATIGGFPVSFIVVAIIYVIMHIVLTRTALGRSIYCAGGNMEATRLSGIDAANVLTFCYALSGFMAAIAGIVSVGRSGICNGANAIQPYDTDAIASCVIGGASMAGGEGNISGTIVGAAIMCVIRNALVMLKVSTYWQSMIIGFIIIAAVMIDQFRRASANKVQKAKIAEATAERNA